MKKKILIVEDNDDMRILAEVLVRKFGYECISVKNGDEGRRLAEKDETIDVILSDIEMPVMDGLQMATQLRMNGFGKPIVFMSGNLHDFGSAVANLTPYSIQKPFNPGILENLLKQALSEDSCKEGSIKKEKVTA